MEEYVDELGDVRSRPMWDQAGNPVHNPQAEAAREQLIEHICAMPPIPTALDALLEHYGVSAVAEVTGRSKRLVRDGSGQQRLESRSPRTNLAETTAFMTGAKAYPGVLRRRRDGPQLPCEPRCQEPAAPGAFSARAGLARRPGDPGAGANAPHPPGLPAVVSSGHHRLQGRSPVHQHDRAAARCARRSDPRPAPDRRAGDVRCLGQPRERLRQARAARLVWAAGDRQTQEHVAERVPGHERA
jgi:hypothetical protein